MSIFPRPLLGNSFVNISRLMVHFGGWFPRNVTAAENKIQIELKPNLNIKIETKECFAYFHVSKFDINI